MVERDRESGQLQASATLAPRKEFPLPIEKVAEWPHCRLGLYKEEESP